MADTVYTSADLTALADELTTSMSKHLKLEYDKGRIVGTDYAQAYVAMSNNAMNQAMQFLLTKDSSGLQVDILSEQKLQAIDQTTVSNATVQDRIDAVMHQTDILEIQVETTGLQRDITSEQKLQAVDLTTISAGTVQDRIDGVAAQTDLTEEQLAVMQERHGMNKTPAFPV